MNKRNRLRVTRSPDATLNPGTDDIVLQTPIPKVRIRKSVEQMVQEERTKTEPVRKYGVYASVFVPCALLLYLACRKVGESVTMISRLTEEVDLLRQENIRMNEYMKRMKECGRGVNHAKIERGARVRVDDPESIFSYGLVGFRRHKDPCTVLDDNVSVGECLALRGSSGRFTIDLDEAVAIDRVGIFHPVTADVSSAVCEFEVFSNADGGVSLGEFRYDSGRCGFQAFGFPQVLTNSVSIVVKSNSGHGRFTCIYKVYLLG